MEPSSRSQAAGQEAQRLTSRKGPYSSMNRGWVRQVRDVASLRYPVNLAQILPVQKGAPAAPEGEAEIPLLVRLERLPQPLPREPGVS